MPSNKLNISNIESLARDPIIIGILLSSFIAIISFGLTIFSFIKQGSTSDTTNPDENVITNNEQTPQIPAKTGDKVWIDTNRDGIQDADELGIAGLTVYLIDTTNKEIKNNSLTDENGNYLFENIVPGNYEIEVVISSNYIASPLQVSGNKETDNDFNIINQSEYGLGRVVKSIPIALIAGEENLSLDAGIHTFEEISGYIWQDLNANEIKDETDRGVQGVIVSLLDEDNNVVDSRISSDRGLYEFNSISPGKFAIKYESNQNFSTQNPALNIATLEQLTSTPKYTDLIEVTLEQKIFDINQNVYELTPELKEALQNTDVETTTEDVTPVPTETDATTTPEVTTTTEETTPTTTVTPTTTLTNTPTESPTEVVTVQTSEDTTTGSGASSQATDSSTAGDNSNLVRTGLPIFILGVLGGINLLMLRFTNTDKSDYQLRKRRVKRYINL